jgi:hypothetical protein
MTRSKLKEIQSRGRLFCDFWVVGYFLSLSRNQVVHLYQTGRLPRVLNSDGSEYRPSGNRLVLASEFAAHVVAAERLGDFEFWRLGAFDVPPSSSLHASPPPFGSLRGGSIITTDPLTVSRLKVRELGDDRLGR